MQCDDMEAWIYARFSSDKQAEGYSLERQFMLVAIGRAEAYLVVRSAAPWPRAMDRPALNCSAIPEGDGIH